MLFTENAEVQTADGQKGDSLEIMEIDSDDVGCLCRGKTDPAVHQCAFRRAAAGASAPG